MWRVFIGFPWHFVHILKSTLRRRHVLKCQIWVKMPLYCQCNKVHSPHCSPFNILWGTFFLYTENSRTTKLQRFEEMHLWTSLDARKCKYQILCSSLVFESTHHTTMLSKWQNLLLLYCLFNNILDPRSQRAGSYKFWL